VKVTERKIKGLFDVELDVLKDERGSLFKPFDTKLFQNAGFDLEWKQVILSHTKYRNTLRGLYVQASPYTEGKLVAPVRGRMWWVAIDVRKDSKTFGQWEASIICPELNTCFLIAPGFAHGCISLTDDADVLLLADNEHNHEQGIGIAWNDAELDISWPLLEKPPVVSDEHKGYQSFAHFKNIVVEV